ncbi:MAG: GGDEF domain-containing protein [Desulfobacteraceae bacterium]
MPFKRNRLNKRVLKDLKERSTFGIFFYMFLVFLTCFTDNFHVRHPGFAALFISSVSGICLFRLFHLVFAKYTVNRFEKINNRIFIISVVLTALIWGAGFLLFILQDGEQKAKFLMVICTAGLSAGGVVTFLPNFMLSLVYNLIMLLPASLVILVSGKNLSLGSALMLFIIYLAFMAYRGNTEYWQALENEYLLKKKSCDLERMSMIDVLTGLYNRRYFDKQLKLEWKRATRNQLNLTMIIADIDLFKTINDTFGHLAGDEYLKKTSGMLKQIFKRETDIVARYGGEEFVVVLPGNNAEKTHKLAEQFRSDIEKTQVHYKNHTIKTTISMGIASCIPEHNASEDSLIFSADTALYKAKNNGRNRIHVL